MQRHGLSRRVLHLHILVLLAAVFAGLAWREYRSTPSSSGEREAMHQALLISETITASLSRPTPSATGTGLERATVTIAALERTRATTGAVLVDVVNRHGVVLFRSGPQLSPAAFDGVAAATRSGGGWRGRLQLASGARLGAAAVALRTPAGAFGGSLVVAVSPTPVSRTIPDLVLTLEALIIALAVGTAGSILATRWLRTQTFGLELDELTNLIREQEAMFHGIREAVVGLDERGIFQFANAEACRVLHLPSRFLHRPATVLVPRGRVQDILTGRIEGKDLVAIYDDRILVMNRRPVIVGERLLGYVVTIVDRTESEVLLRELEGMLGLTEALRAQAHDFSNRLHTIVGLIELGAPAEAARFATDLTVRDANLAERLVTEVGHPMLVALLLAKSAVAAERNVQLRLAPSTRVPDDVPSPADLITVVGNLVDNAVEATQGQEPAWVEVQVRRANGRLEIEVSDSGPGVPPDNLEAIFVDGYSTKMATSGARRGLGLALVRQLVHRWGGSISVTCRIGAVFTVVLPLGPAPGGGLTIDDETGSLAGTDVAAGSRG
jgi:two-component system CitB family sensor kinase